MKSLAELDAIRQRAQANLTVRNEGSRKVVVGMATYGIAAGARPVMNTLVEEIRTRGLNDVTVTMTGCIGICRLEPIAEVYEADGTKVTYVKLDANKARRIVAEHLVNGSVCEDLTIGAAETEAKNA